jgi:protein gp37
METTRIEWCSSTWNPWIGCSKVSPGCTNCYAEREAARRGWSTWGPDSARYVTSLEYWDQLLRWNKKAANSREPVRVFCGSLCDVFEDRSDLRERREQALRLMEYYTQHLTWLLLTKRPENIRKMVPDYWLHGCWPKNVWIGTSVENQEWANIRIPELLRVPAQHRFLSCEPLLGPLDLTPWLWVESLNPNYYLPKQPNVIIMPSCTIQWIIAGGESGPKARPMHPDWVRSLRDQCVEANVPFFFKSWGEFVPPHQGVQLSLTPTGEARRASVARIPGELPSPVFRIGKQLSGYLLDDQEWQQFPE